jgi:hypothetical protein
MFEPAVAAVGCVHHIRGVPCYHISVALHLIFEAYVHTVTKPTNSSHPLQRGNREKIYFECGTVFAAVD